MLLGCSLDEDEAQVSFYKKLNPRSMLEKTKNRNFGISLGMKNSNILSFPVEELTSLFFSHLKGLTNVSDCIITVILI